MRRRVFTAVWVLMLVACSREQKSPLLGGHVARTRSSTNTAVPVAFIPPAPIRTSNDVTAPIIIKRVDPPLPSRMKVAGPLILEMVISKSGRARDVKVLRDGTSPRLGPAYANALLQWRFQPGTRRGQPVDVVFNLSVHIDVR